MNIPDLLLTLYMLLVLLLFLSSITLWGWIGYRLSRGEQVLPARFRWRRSEIPAFPVLITLGLLGLLGLSFWAMSSSVDNAAERTPEMIRRIVIATVLEGVVVFPVLLGSLAISLGQRVKWIRLGFRSDDLRRQFLEGVLGMIASLVPVMLVLVSTLSLRAPESNHPFLQLLKESDSWLLIAMVVISAVVIAPLKEELMFRVILQSWLEEFCPPWVAIVLTALVFSGIHGMPDALALIPLALILGVLYYRRRSYLTIVTVHALFNAYNILGAFNS